MNFQFQCPAMSPTPRGQTGGQNFALCTALRNRPHRKSGPAKVGQANKSLIVFLGGYIFKHILSRHEILMLSRSPIKCEQRPDLTIAVDWDVPGVRILMFKLRHFPCTAGTLEK